MSAREIINVDDIDIFVISKNDLIKNKKTSGRTMDLADAENLAKYRDEQ